MRKTTIYLPDELKDRLEHVARARDTSEAEVIRSALVEYVGRERPRPRLPLVRGDGTTDVAERVDELLAGGFGRA